MSIKNFLKFTKIIKSKKLLIICLGILVILGVFLFFLLISKINNQFLYPDSFVYILGGNTFSFFKKAIEVNGLPIKVEYLTTIKPIAFAFTSLVFNSGILPKLFNLSLLFISLLLVFISVENLTSLNLLKKGSLSRKILIILIFFALLFNGNILYWISRYTTEYLAISLISISIYCIAKRKITMFFVFYILLILTRTEFFIVLPLVHLSLSTYKLKKINLIYFLLLIYFFLISILFGALSSFLINIFLPFSVIYLISLLILKYYKQVVPIILKLDKLFVILMCIFFIIIFSISILSLLGLVTIPTILTGLTNTFILMFAILAIFFTTRLFTEPTKLNALLDSIMLVLGIAYLLTASDSFRYFLMLLPLISISLLTINIKRNTKGILILSTLFIFIQLFLLIKVLPWSALNNNYWSDRFQGLSSIKELTSNKNNYTIYSTTPIISTLDGYKSNDICELSTSQINNTIIILDNYVVVKCNDKYLKILDIIRSKNLTPLYEFNTNEYVEIERYKSFGQESQIFKINT